MSRSRRRTSPLAACSGLLVIAILAATAVLSARGQQATQPPQQPVFRSGVQVIEVDVRVFDRDGGFVPDLTRDDFEVLEDGVPQHLVAMALVGTPIAAAPAAEHAVPQAAAGQTNNQQLATSNRHTWVFFFDLNHLTAGGGFERARAASADFIRSRFTEGDLAGVIADSKFVNDRLTTVREELVAAVQSVKPRTDSRNRQFELTREWPRLRDASEAIQIARGELEAIKRAVVRACYDDSTLCEQAELQVRSKGSRLGAEFHRATMNTLTGLDRLASGLARMEGPKTLVLLSDGFVAETFETTLRGVVGQLARAGTRVYAIDVRGLNRGRGAGIIDQEFLDHEVGGPPSFDDLADGVNSLAIDTGGMMIRNANNIGWALDRIAADTGRYYVIGYQPTNTAFDGEFRTIEVRVKRPGVRVRARRGYLALEPSKMLRPQPIEGPRQPVRVSTLDIAEPAVLATIDLSEVKGQPSRLAWSPDGSELYFQTLEGAFGKPDATLRHYLFALATGARTTLEAEPEWAAAYWTVKSWKMSPDEKPLEIELRSEQRVAQTTSVPRGGDLARGGTSSGAGSSAEEGIKAAYNRQIVHTHSMRLHGELVGLFENTVIVPGLTFGWGPPGSRLIAFAAQNSGRIIVMDGDGRKKNVPDSKDGLLPAWAPDGTRLAWLQKDGRRQLVLQISRIGG